MNSKVQPEQYLEQPTNAKMNNQQSLAQQTFVIPDHNCNHEFEKFEAKANKKLADGADHISNNQTISQAKTMSILPYQYSPCCSCSKIPQQYFSLFIDSKELCKIIRGPSNVTTCCQAITKQCTCCECNPPQCGLGCSQFCDVCKGTCCICCKDKIGKVETIQNFADYENMVNVLHTVTQLGTQIGYSDKLFFNKEREGWGAQYHYITDLSLYKNTLNEYESLMQKAGQDQQNKMKDQLKKVKVSDAGKVAKFLANIYKNGPSVSMVFDCCKLLFSDSIKQCFKGIPNKQTYLKQLPLKYYSEEEYCYGVFFNGRYQGRILQGWTDQDKCCEMIQKDLYVFDDYDTLIYRVHQKQSNCYCCKPKGNHWDFDICDVTNVSVGRLEYKATKSCGCCWKFEWILTFPSNLIDPNKKMLLAYAVPFLYYHYSPALNNAHLKFPLAWNSGKWNETQYALKDEIEPGDQLGIEETLMTRISRIPSYEEADKNKIPDLIMDIGYHEKNPEVDKEQRKFIMSKQPALNKHYTKKYIGTPKEYTKM